MKVRPAFPAGYHRAVNALCRRDFHTSTERIDVTTDFGAGAEPMKASGPRRGRRGQLLVSSARSARSALV